MKAGSLSLLLSEGNNPLPHLSVKVRLFSFKYNPKNLDLSYKTYLDLWDCLGRVNLITISKFYRNAYVVCSHSRETRLIAE